MHDATVPILLDVADAINEIEAEGREVRWVKITPLIESGSAWIGGILEGKLGEPAAFARDREIVISSVDWFCVQDNIRAQLTPKVFDQEAKETLFGFEVIYD